VKELEAKRLMVWNGEVQWSGRKSVLDVLEEGKYFFLREEGVGLMTFASICYLDV